MADPSEDRMKDILVRTFMLSAAQIKAAPNAIVRATALLAATCIKASPSPKATYEMFTTEFKSHMLKKE